MCSAGVSPQAIQQQLQQVQGTCQIVTALAKTAIKSYFFGAVIGALGEINTVKQIGDGVQAYKRSKLLA